MLFIKGLGRYVALLIVVLVFFLLSGGHLYLLWQPFPMGMIFGIYLLSSIWLVGISANFEKLAYAGRRALEAGVVLPSILGIIQALSYTESGVSVVSQMTAASLAGVFHASAIYFSFYAPLTTANNPTDSASGTNREYMFGFGAFVLGILVLYAVFKN